MDRANIVRNSNGAFKQQPCPAATRRLRQQLPRQRYLTYNICLNHDVVRLHKPVPEPEHGALYSSQAATMEMDVCEHEEACVHVYLRICVCIRCTLVPFTKILVPLIKNLSRSALSIFSINMPEFGIPFISVGRCCGKKSVQVLDF